MIKRSEITKLLSLAAAFDQRTIGEADIEAWSAAAEVGRWDPTAVRRVIVEHYSRDTNRPRLDPAAVSDRLRGLRNQAAESFEAPVIPEDLPNADYPAWLRARLTVHVDAQLERWARCGQEPDRAAIVAPVNGSLAELVANAPEHVRAELDAAVQKITRRSTR